ncbi:MAG: B12-binding domain-containing radical SAM protein [Suipraeoptans sp.]
MKVLLVAINSKYIHSNLAVYSLKAYAKSTASKLSIDVTIAEYTINQNIDEILGDIYLQKPDRVCFSVYIWNVDIVEKLIDEITKIMPKSEIWCGGPEVSYDASDFLRRNEGAAGVMSGEGEETFDELLTGFADSLKFQGINGITYREGNNIIVNSNRSQMDLNQVPFIYNDISEFENKIIYYEGSRGCPYSCSYCLSSIDKSLRFRDVKKIKEELQFFLDNKVKQVKFVDRTFNCSSEYAEKIWQYLLDNDNGITNFHFEIAADVLTERELRIIKGMRPGLIQLEIGIQSTNEKTINEIRRKMDFDKVRSNVLTIKGYKNVHQHVDLIAGLPYENLESFSRSFDMVYALHAEQLQLGFLKVLKGSYMEEMKEQYELKYNSHPPYEVLTTKWISYMDILLLKSIEEMVETYYNSGQFKITIDYLETMYSSPFLMYEQIAKFYKANNYFGIKHSRSKRYEILLSYVECYHEESKEYFRELLTLDYYLRENAKGRPKFAFEYCLDKDETRAIYNRLEIVPTKNMAHIERFPIMKKTYLFDYSKRDPMTNEAILTEVL